MAVASRYVDSAVGPHQGIHCRLPGQDGHDEQFLRIAEHYGFTTEESHLWTITHYPGWRFSIHAPTNPRSSFMNTGHILCARHEYSVGFRGSVTIATDASGLVADVNTWKPNGWTTKGLRPTETTQSTVDVDDIIAEFDNDHRTRALELASSQPLFPAENEVETYHVEFLENPMLISMQWSV
jgi:hypothetical protein